MDHFPQPFFPSPELQTTDVLPVMKTSPNVLDFDKIAAHIPKAVERGRYHGPTDPIDYLLHNKCLLPVGTELYATVAGVLCFGREPQASIPRAVVDVGRYRGLDAISSEVEHLRKNIGGTIFDQITYIEQYLWEHIQHGMTISEQSFQRVEIHEYPQIVLRELSVNMLAHRDYGNHFSTSRVQLFRNRIEWVSPGGLPNGITVENLLTEQSSRNPIVLEILYQAGYVEAFGQGLDSVVAALRREEMLAPKFEDTGASFIVTIFGRNPDIFAEQTVQANLNDYQRIIYTYIQAHREATFAQLANACPDRSERSLQRDIDELVRVGLIKRTGTARATRYHLDS